LVVLFDLVALLLLRVVLVPVFSAMGAPLWWLASKEISSKSVLQ
jgi:hypothetical protein